MSTDPEPRFEVRVGVVPSSANRRLRMHWSARRREDQALHWAMKQALGVAGRPRHHGRAAYVHCAFRVPGRADDIDNRVARMKPVIDVLVAEDVLVDDSPQWLRITMPEHARAFVPETTVVIRYVPAFE